jgi:hypothetical protein
MWLAFVTQQQQQKEYCNACETNDYLASLGTLLQGRTKVVLREFAAHGGRGMLGHDEGLDGLK